MRRFFVTDLEKARVREAEVVARGKEAGGVAVINRDQVLAGTASAPSAARESRTLPVNAVSICPARIVAQEWFASNQNEYRPYGCNTKS